ncbi:MAG TPA: hypothetical protein VGI47_05875 [Candidatus Binataceae bacterium]
MAAPRLKSSFIYLANAVNDLGGNWTTMGAVLAPLVVTASLCLLPDALNLQHSLVSTFEPGVQNVVADAGAGALLVQQPYRPQTDPSPPPFSAGVTTSLHVMLGFITLSVTLVVLCLLWRIQTGKRRSHILNEVVDVYRGAWRIFLPFLWIDALAIVVGAILFVLLLAPLMLLTILAYFGQTVFVPLNPITTVLPGLIVFLWLHFAPFALVFEDRRGLAALLSSRELIRRRFFKVAARLLVFLAVGTGYNSWASAVFVAVSLILGLLGVVTGFLWVAVFTVDLLSVAVAYTTIAFICAASLRLYQDLNESMALPSIADRVAATPTIPLRNPP